MLVTGVAFFLAYLLLNAGLAKAFDPKPALLSVRRLAPRLWRFAPAIVLGVAAAELGIALLLLTSPLMVLGLTGASVLLLVFLVVVAFQSRQSGPQSGCGCGPVSTPVGSATIGRNALLLALAITGVAIGRAGRDVDRTLGHTESQIAAAVLLGWLLLPQLCLTVYVYVMERRLQTRFLLTDSPDTYPTDSRSTNVRRGAPMAVTVLGSSLMATAQLTVPVWFRTTFLALHVVRHRKIDRSTAANVAGPLA